MSIESLLVGGGPGIVTGADRLAAGETIEVKGTPWSELPEEEKARYRPASELTAEQRAAYGLEAASIAKSELHTWRVEYQMVKTLTVHAKDINEAELGAAARLGDGATVLNVWRSDATVREVCEAMDRKPQIHKPTDKVRVYRTA